MEKKIPEFDGREAYGWLIMVEQHCEAMGIPEEKKLSEAEKALTRDAILWWFCWKRRNQKATWWDFVTALLREFEPELEPYLPEPVLDSGEEETPRKQEILGEERRTALMEAKPEANSVLLTKSETKPYLPENSEMEASRKDSEFAMAAEQTAEVSRCQPVTVVDYIREVWEEEETTDSVEAKPEANSGLAESEIMPHSQENSETEASQEDSDFAAAAERTVVASQCKSDAVVDFSGCLLTAKGEKIDAEGEIKIKRLQEGSSMEKLQICNIHGRKKVQPIVLPQISDLGFDWERRPPRKPPDSCLRTPVTANRPPETFLGWTGVSKQTSVSCSSMVSNRLATESPDRSGGGSCFISGDPCGSDSLAMRPPAKPSDSVETAGWRGCSFEFGVRVAKRKGSSLMCTPEPALRPPAKPPDLAVTAVEERKLKWGRYGFGYLPLAPCEVQAWHVREVGPSEKALVEPLSNPNGPSPIHSWKEFEPGRR